MRLHLVTPLLVVLTVAQAPCYFPGGDWASGYYPCDPTAYTTLCCQIGWTCFSNGLCMITDPSTANATYQVGTTFRGACTNPKWNASACGAFCLSLYQSEGPIFLPAIADRILDDPVSDNNGNLEQCDTNKFCCKPDASDGTCSCADGNGTFSVENGRAITIISGEDQSLTTVPPFLGHASVTSTMMTATSKPLSSARSSPTSSASPTDAVASSSAAPASKPIDKRGVKAAIAVCVVVGVIGLIGLGIWFLCYRRRRGDVGYADPTSDVMDEIPVGMVTPPPPGFDPYSAQGVYREPRQADPSRSGVAIAPPVGPDNPYEHWATSRTSTPGGY